MLTHVRTLEPAVIADLDTLLVALYVELTDAIIPPLAQADAARAGRRW